MSIVISLLAGILTTVIAVGVIFAWKKQRINILDRLDIYIYNESQSYIVPELEKPFKERIGLIIMSYVSRFTRKFITKNKKEAYEGKLRAAGNPHGMTIESYIALKYLFLLFTVILGIIAGNTASFILCVLMGFLIPDMYLKMEGKKRKNDILRSLPNVLDLITVSVQAGLGFDAALQKVIDKFEGPLTDEFTQALNEINMGKHRREALKDMAQRINLNEVTTFLGSIIQADQLGVSITNVLKVQSEQVRAGRRMRAEETAQKAPVKILLPLVLFIFPAILIVLLGPAVLQLMGSF